jgi:hypothetical protein
MVEVIAGVRPSYVKQYKTNTSRRACKNGSKDLRSVTDFSAVQRTALMTGEHKKEDIFHKPDEHERNERRKIDPAGRWQSASDRFDQGISHFVDEAGDGL